MQQFGTVPPGDDSPRGQHVARRDDTGPASGSTAGGTTGGTIGSDTAGHDPAREVGGERAGGLVSTLDHPGERARVLDGAFAAASDAIVITDPRQPDNPIVAVNPAFERITGYAAHEVLGRNCRFLQGDDRAQSEVSVLRAAIREARPVLVTLRNYRRDGTLFWNELRVSPVFDDAGTLTHFIGIQNDISDRVHVEQALVRRSADLEQARDDFQDQTLQLVEATQTRDRFMATISHEMRTPINAVLGYADLLELGLAGALDESQRAFVTRIRQSSRQLLDLVNDVLDLTRAELGHLEVDATWIDPLPVVEEVMALLEEQAARKGLVLRAELPPQRAVELWADRRRLRQILVNLVANAIKFTDRGTVTLRIDGGVEAGWARVTVDDTGIGISPEQLPLVFDEFFQADSRLTRRHGGAGLGLSISQRLARLMGGDLSATSTPGAGSTFALRLAARVTPRSADAGSTADVRTPPAALTPAMAAAAAFLEEPPPDAGARETLREVPGGQTVVVFGPDEEALAALGRVLYPDVRLLRVNDAAGVARAVRETAASLVVVDVTAADGQGWDIAHALRAEPGLEEVPLLLLPTRSPRAVRGAATAFDLGVVAFAERLAPRIGEERPEPTGTDAPPATADDAAVRLARTVERIAARPRTPHGPGEPLPRGQVADVLLVDDDPDARRITARVLRAAGAEVREAPDGESALDAMRRRRPDVAVVDLMMPVVDGFGLLTAMRADPRLRGVPVVVLTTKALTPAERRYLARTAEEVLEKGEHRMSDVATLILRAAKR